MPLTYNVSLRSEVLSDFENISELLELHIEHNPIMMIIQLKQYLLVLVYKKKHPYIYDSVDRSKDL